MRLLVTGAAGMLGRDVVAAAESAGHDVIALAHELDLLTCPYAFTPEEATQMAKAGADVLIPHMGLTTKGSIGAKSALTLADASKKVQELADAAKKVKPDILVLCHGGPISEPSDVR